MKQEKNKGYVATMCPNPELEVLDQKHAFICVNKILNDIDKEMTHEKFEQEFAKLDYDGDEEITMVEMANFIQKRLYRQELLLIGVYWIGHCLNPKEEQHKHKIKKMLTRKYSDIDQTRIHPWYEINVEGYPSCLNDHLIQVANGENTHVLLMDDYQDDQSITLSDLPLDVNFDRATDINYKDRKGQQRVHFVERCNIDHFLRFFVEAKKQSQVFVFPY